MAAHILQKSAAGIMKIQGPISAANCSRSNIYIHNLMTFVVNFFNDFDFQARLCMKTRIKTIGLQRIIYYYKINDAHSH